jgi:hypothetical protein
MLVVFAGEIVGAGAEVAYENRLAEAGADLGLLADGAALPSLQTSYILYVELDVC